MSYAVSSHFQEMFEAGQGFLDVGLHSYCTRSCQITRLYYTCRKRFLYCASGALGEREREREKDGSDVTLVALKLAMSIALFLAKKLHLSFSSLE